MANTIKTQTIRRLSSGQLKRYYQEYLRAKETKYAGAAMDFNTWRNEIEEYLNRHASVYGKGFSNTQVEAANRKFMESGNYSGKQKSALRASFERAVAGTPENDKEQAFWDDFRAKNPNISAKNFGNNWAVIYSFLETNSGNWNTYFNS